MSESTQFGLTKKSNKSVNPSLLTVLKSILPCWWRENVFSISNIHTLYVLSLNISLSFVMILVQTQRVPILSMYVWVFYIIVEYLQVRNLSIASWCTKIRIHNNHFQNMLKSFFCFTWCPSIIIIRYLLLQGKSFIWTMKQKNVLNPIKTSVKLKTYFVYDNPQQILFWGNGHSPIVLVFVPLSSKKNHWLCLFVGRSCALRQRQWSRQPPAQNTFVQLVSYNHSTSPIMFNKNNDLNICKIHYYSRPPLNHTLFLHTVVSSTQKYLM